MKKLSCIVVFTFIIFSLFLSGYTLAAEKVVKKFTISHVFATDHPVHLGWLKANDLLKEKSNGKYEFKIHPAGTYANYKDAIRAVKMGVLDLCPLDTAIDDYPESGVLLSPYTFRDYDHWKNFKKSDVYRELKKNIGERVGVKQMDMYTFGFRHATTKSVQAKSPEEFKGLKLRVVNFPPYPEAATVLNANGTPLPIGEVYMALSTGVAEGQENPFTQILTMKFYEVQKYLILTGHMLATSGTIMSKKAWNGLSDDEKKMFEEVLAAQAEFIDQEVINKENQLLEILKKKGMEVIEVDREPFMARVPLVLKKYPDFIELYEKIQNVK